MLPRLAVLPPSGGASAPDLNASEDFVTRSELLCDETGSPLARARERRGPPACRVPDSTKSLRAASRLCAEEPSDHHRDADARELRVARRPPGEPVEVELLLAQRERVERVADQDPLPGERELLRVDAVGEDRRPPAARPRPEQRRGRPGRRRRPCQPDDGHEREQACHRARDVRGAVGRHLRDPARRPCGRQRDEERQPDLVPAGAHRDGRAARSRRLPQRGRERIARKSIGTATTRKTTSKGAATTAAATCLRPRRRLAPDHAAVVGRRLDQGRRGEEGQPIPARTPTAVERSCRRARSKSR